MQIIDLYMRMEHIVEMPSHADPEKCTGCGYCAENCPEEAIAMNDKIPTVDVTKCTECGVCVSTCPSEARSLE